MMDHVVFNKFIKAASPFYKEINRQTIKKDGISTYTIEKNETKIIIESCW